MRGSGWDGREGEYVRGSGWDGKQRGRGKGWD